MEKNLDKVDWWQLSRNINAVHILEKNQNKVFWSMSEKNTGKISFTQLVRNKNIYTYDYNYYKKRMDLHREELMKKVFHPNRLIYYLEIGYEFADM